MIKASESKIVESMYRVYRRRLVEALRVRDDSGNIVIDKDLKVRHDASGFEYTVADVSGDPLTIKLRKPEEPRFEPSGQEFVGESSLDMPNADGDFDSATHDQQLMMSFGGDQQGEVESETVFTVDEKEFEQNYSLEPAETHEKPIKSSGSKPKTKSAQKVKKGVRR